MFRAVASVLDASDWLLLVGVLVIVTAIAAFDWRLAGLALGAVLVFVALASGEPT